MNFRNLFFVMTLTGITLVTCAQERNNGYTLTGDIEGLQNAEGYIYLYGAVQNGEQVNDSLPINNGHFVFKGYTEEPVRATIYFQSKYQVKANTIFEFFLENSNIKITGVSDTTQLLSLKEGRVTGSRLQDEFTKFNEDATKFTGFNKWQEEYMAAMAKKDTVTIAALQNRSKECYVKYDKFVEDYRKNNPNSLVYLYVLSAGLNPRDEQSLKDLSGKILSMDSDIQSSVAGKNLIKQVDFYLRGFIVGKQVGDFTQIDKDEKVVKLSDYRGKYLLLDFWASWCGPCRAENPNLLKAFNKYHGKGLEIVAVSLDTKRESWLKAIAKDNLPWIQVSDLKERNEVANQFGVNSIPDNFLIDPNGIVIARTLRGEELDKKLSEIFK
ncbi:MAG: AhpC/TSA family protein [Marinifilaceae bacterium]|nr:AhpC/TSA family protein [Marinifilaceae bacterium]